MATTSTTTSSSPTPKASTLADAFALVQCTPGQSVAILNRVMNMLTDIDPEMANSFQTAIETLQSQ